jgi:hypothetical protein
MDRIEQRLRVAPKPLPQRAEDEGNDRSGRHAPRDVFLHSLGPGDALPDAEAVIFSILPILAILSKQLQLQLQFPSRCRSCPDAFSLTPPMHDV